MTTIWQWWAATTCAALLVGCAMSYDSDKMANENFDIWCGDHACAWQVETGTVIQVPTWHRAAKGIGFESDSTVISQVVSLQETRCLSLSILGDLTEDARLYWQVDFNNDGMDAADSNEAVPDMDWQPHLASVPVPPDCSEARIILKKTGKGEAVLAHARLTGTIADGGGVCEN